MGLIWVLIRLRGRYVGDGKDIRDGRRKNFVTSVFGW